MIVLTIWLACELKRNGNFVDAHNELTTILLTLAVFCFGYSMQVAKNALAFMILDTNDTCLSNKFADKYIDIFQLFTYILQDIVPIVAILCIHRRNFSDDPSCLIRYEVDSLTYSSSE